MAGLIRGLIGPVIEPIVKPIMRPITRVLVGLIAIPLFRIFRRKVVRVHELNEELEKDVDQWFRGSILLLLATQNLEPKIFWWTEHVPAMSGEAIHMNWITLTFRLLLAIKVVEGMPDQTLFAIIHPGMSRVKIDRTRGVLRSFWEQRKEAFLGALSQHLNRSSPVFAILSTILEGGLGWIFYFLAIFQYLIIGLVTSRDRALDVLNEFDRRVAERRQELIEELELPKDAPGDSPDVHQPHGSQ